MLVGLLLLPFLGALTAAAVPLGFTGRSADRVAQRLFLAVTGAVLVWSLALLPGFSAAAADRVRHQVDVPWVAAVDVRFHLGVDGVSLPLVVLTALLTFLCAVYTLHTVPAPGRVHRLAALVLLLEVGMLGSFLALDLVLFFLFFELVLVPMYLVIAVWGGARRGPAATTFILYTLLGSVFVLVGLLAVWAGTDPHTFDMVELARRGGAGMGRGYQTLAFLGLAAGFAVKTPLWPLHTWLPDAHTEAPTVGSVLLAGVLLKLGTYGFVRIALPELPLGARAVAPWLAVLAVVSILYGALACLAQTGLKRLIAYSSVGHMGFVVLGIATLSPVGVDAALFGNVAHGLVTGLLFFCVGSLKDRFGTDTLADLGGLRTKTPLLGGLLTFAAVASLGLPGLASFWGEALALLAAYRPAGDLPRGLFLALMGLAAVGSVLTAAYFLRLLRQVTQGRVPDRFRAVPLADVGAVELLAWAPLLALVLTLGLWPRLVLGLTDQAVRGLLGAGG